MCCMYATFIMHSLQHMCILHLCVKCKQNALNCSMCPACMHYTCVTYICLACVHGFMCHMHVRCTCACCYYVTCTSNTHVHVATMPHECQVDVCMLLLCYMHVKYARAFWCYVACMSSTHVHIATMPHAYQTLMCMLLLGHVHVNLPTIPRYVIDPYQISLTLMLLIPTQTQCMYHRVSYISTVLDFLLITFHKGNSIRLSVCAPTS